MLKQNLDYTKETAEDSVIFNLSKGLTDWDTTYLSKCFKGIVEEIREDEKDYRKKYYPLAEARKNYAIKVNSGEEKAVLQYALNDFERKLEENPIDNVWSRKGQITFGCSYLGILLSSIALSFLSKADLIAVGGLFGGFFPSLYLWHHVDKREARKIRNLISKLRIDYPQDSH